MAGSTSKYRRCWTPICAPSHEEDQVNWQKHSSLNRHWWRMEVFASGTPHGRIWWLYWWQHRWALLWIEPWETSIDSGLIYWIPFPHVASYQKHSISRLIQMFSFKVNTHPHNSAAVSPMGINSTNLSLIFLAEYDVHSTRTSSQFRTTRVLVSSLWFFHGSNESDFDLKW